MSPVSSTGRSPSARSSETASALVGLHGVGDLEQPARLAVPAGRDAVRPDAPARAASAAGEPRRQLDARVARAAPGRPTSSACPSTTPSTPSPSRLTNSSTAGSSPTSAARGARRSRAPIGCSDACSSAPTRRSSSARSTPVGERRRRRRHAPARDGAGLVEHDRVDAARRLEHLGPLDQDAELRAAAGADEQRRRRREPERAGAGDDQHRDGGRQRERRRSRRRASQTPSVASGERDHDGHEDRRDPVGEPLHRRPCPSGPRVTRRPICASAVSAPTLVGADHEPPAGVRRSRRRPRRPGASRRASTRRSAATGRRPRSPPRRCRRSRSSRPAARRSDRRPRARRSGTRRSLPSAPSTATSLAPSSSSARSAAPERRLRARLEVAAGEDERRHDGRDLEVDRVARRRPARCTSSNGMRMSDAPGAEEAERDDRPAPGGERADADQRVHRRRAVAQVPPGGDVERPARPRARRASRARATSHCQ